MQNNINLCKFVTNLNIFFNSSLKGKYEIFLRHSIFAVNNKSQLFSVKMFP